MNMKLKNIGMQLAGIHKVLGSPFRIRLLYAIGSGEACVCHLETIMKKRQAYISQHLMVLRDAGLLLTRREGKYIYYRVPGEEVFELLEKTAEVGGINRDQLPVLSSRDVKLECVCPKCNP
jgi:ArsR family transcriptional regulator